MRIYRRYILLGMREKKNALSVGTSNLKDDGGQTIHPADKGFEKAQSGFGRRSYVDVAGKICP